MKMNNWTTNATKVRAWAGNQPESDKLNAVMLSLTLGESADSDELRSTYWTAIRSIGSTMDGFPSARRGRESGLTDEVEIVLANVEGVVATAIATIPTEFHPMLLSVIVPHGRTGGKFEEFGDLVSHIKKQAHNYMLTSIKENRWNGEDVDKKTGVPQITPRPTKADTEGEEQV